MIRFSLETKGINDVLKALRGEKMSARLASHDSRLKIQESMQTPMKVLQIRKEETHHSPLTIHH